MGFNITPVEIAQGSEKWLALLIVLAPLAAAVLGLFLKRRPEWINRVTPFFAAVSLLATFWIIPHVQERALIIPVMPFLNFYLDALSIYIVLLANLVAFFTSFSIAQFLRADARGNAYHNPARFNLYYNLFQTTMLLVPMVENLVTLWIAVELTTVFSTMLIRYNRDRLSLEAAWKLIMITTTGIIFALLGTLFMANAIPVDRFQNRLSNDWMSWAFLADPNIAAQLNPNFIKLSFLFILLGYGTKAGLAPTHTWLPDSHGEAPAPVSALLSGVMLKTALYAILRFYTITRLSLAGSQPSFASDLLLVVGAFSLILAVPFIIKTNRFKRTLAYHSLEHIGIITFGIGIGTPVALFAALLHALNHALTKALVFLVFGSIQYEYQERCGEARAGSHEDAGIQGVLRAMPLSGTILAFGGLALAGSPPFSIFMSQFMILWAAMQEFAANSRWLLGFALFCFVAAIAVIFGGVVRHLARLLLGPAPFQPGKLNLLHWKVLAPLLILMAVILLSGFLLPGQPVDLPQVIQRSVWIVQNGVSLEQFTGVQ